MITTLHYKNSIGHITKDKIKTETLVDVSNKKNNLFVQNDFSKEEKISIVSNGQSSDLLVDDICSQYNISIDLFHEWSDEYLGKKVVSDVIVDDKTKSHGYKLQIVRDGKEGKYSVAEICRREGISQDLFLTWCDEFQFVEKRDSILHHLNSRIYKKNIDLLLQDSNEDVANYCKNYVDLDSLNTKIVIKSNIIEMDNNEISRNIICLQRINDIRFINKYLEKVNSKLVQGGIFIGCLETFSARKERLVINKFPVLNNLYFGFEFLIKRILPKVSFTKKYYFDLTKGSDRLLSKAEGLGRLVSCGFRIMDFKTINGLIYFVVKKDRDPYFDENPSYGPLYKMPRLGKNGRIIGVYKFRTMHPYSEYLQDYLINAYGYAKTGKPDNDFRIPAWGKAMRRIWIDELPQLINVLKGDMKLVGIRPVSQRYFQDIPKEMQKLRLTQKPGCIPPYVALNREGNVMSVLQAEKEYLEEKIRRPYTTDLRYFFKAFFNILFMNKRSA